MRGHRRKPRATRVTAVGPWRDESVPVLACRVHQQRRVDASVDTLLVNPPAGLPWELGAFRILAECRGASGGKSGDFYACRLRGPKRLAGVIGDACGRGEEGASLLPSILRRVEELAGTWVQPSHLLQDLNRLMAGELPLDRFVTAAAFELDAQAGTLTVANAAHVPIVVRRASGVVSVVGRPSGPPLGILGDSSYFNETCRLGRGDVVVLMTDGILEAIETDLAEMPRVTSIVAATKGNSGDVHRSLLAQLALKKAEQRADDTTLVSLELLAEPTRSRRPNLHQTI